MDAGEKAKIAVLNQFQFVLRASLISAQPAKPRKRSSKKHST
jgi:hypothetical protein